MTSSTYQKRKLHILQYPKKKHNTGNSGAMFCLKKLFLLSSETPVCYDNCLMCTIHIWSLPWSSTLDRHTYIPDA